MHPMSEKSREAGLYRGMQLLDFYLSTRERTLRLIEPLSAEDCQIQSMPDVSPTKWHLAHTTWFFETFVLEERSKNFAPFHPQYRVLYNSYYNAVGEQFARPQRGLLSRPSLDEVLAYRAHVDARMEELISSSSDGELARLVEIGLHHEEQHQELLLMDIKHVLATNPLRPAYREDLSHSPGEASPLQWQDSEERIVEIGHEGPGFSYDNEKPRHRSLIARHSLASRCVTSGEYLEFMADGGYERPELWLSEGWAWLAAEGARAPLYWEEVDGRWIETTLGGSRAVLPDAPVVHVSHFEADAYARWANARLPSEQEWEAAAAEADPADANDLQSDVLHPQPAGPGEGPRQLFGDVWEWTQSSYGPYPGYRTPEGAIGEYNGKFMCNQYVLRGGSCVTPRGHARASYRNFFPAHSRWMFSGFRLARDLA